MTHSDTFQQAGKVSRGYCQGREVKKMAMASGIFALINIGLLIGGIVGFVLFMIVLFKLNKALSIWLRKNGEE